MFKATFFGFGDGTFEDFRAWGELRIVLGTACPVESIRTVWGRVGLHFLSLKIVCPLLYFARNILIPLAHRILDNILQSVVLSSDNLFVRARDRVRRLAINLE